MTKSKSRKIKKVRIVDGRSESSSLGSESEEENFLPKFDAPRSVAPEEFLGFLKEFGPDSFTKRRKSVIPAGAVTATTDVQMRCPACEGEICKCTSASSQPVRFFNSRN